MEENDHVKFLIHLSVQVDEVIFKIDSKIDECADSQAAKVYARLVLEMFSFNKQIDAAVDDLRRIYRKRKGS